MEGRPHNHNRNIFRTNGNRARNTGHAGNIRDAGDDAYAGDGPYDDNGSYDGGGLYCDNAGCGANVFPGRKVC